MELDLTGKFRVAKVAVRLENVDAQLYRRCRMTLEAEFDGIMAATLGKDATAVRNAVIAGTVSKATLPTDNVMSEASLTDETNDRRCRIGVVHGIKATVSRGPDATEQSEDAQPDGGDIESEPTAVVRMEFEFPFSDEAWLFLGHTAGAWCDVRLRRLQQALPGTEKPPRKLEAV